MSKAFRRRRPEDATVRRRLRNAVTILVLQLLDAAKLRSHVAQLRVIVQFDHEHGAILVEILLIGSKAFGSAAAI